MYVCLRHVETKRAYPHTTVIRMREESRPEAGVRLEHNPGLVHGRPRFSYLSHHHCLPASVLAESWSKELEVGIEHGFSNVDAGKCLLPDSAMVMIYNGSSKCS